MGRSMTKEPERPSWSMICGYRYIVTKASKNREFQVGDKIKLCDDGSILNLKVAGLMPAEDVAEATFGMTVKLDLQWYKDQRQKLIAKLATMPKLDGATA
jgi:hypothetical protein